MLSGSEEFLDVDVGRFTGIELEQIACTKPEQASDYQVGESFDTDVIDVDRLVVKLAAVGNGVFQRTAFLKL